MLHTLNRVRGAVSTKELVPVLTHFHVRDGRIQGGDGKVFIDAPIDTELEFTVPAKPFLKAVDACGGDPKLSLGEQFLTVSKGSLRVRLPLEHPDSYPRAEKPSQVTRNDGLVGALRRVEPFLGDDATRIWSCGVLLQEGRAYATNNVSIIAVDCAYQGDPVVLPGFALREILRIGEEPVASCVDERSFGVEWEDGSWLRTSLYDVKWPDIAQVLVPPERPSWTMTSSLIKPIETLLPFCPDPKHPIVKVDESGFYTEDGEMSAEIQESAFTHEAVFRGDYLLAVTKVAAELDVSSYPDPCFFRGPGLIGAIAGVRE